MARKVDREGTIKRRGQILKAAGKCFAVKGFHQSSMADICKEAGLSPGTVYHYFRSKDEMILHFAQRELEQAQEYAEALENFGSVEELVDFTISAILGSEDHGELQFYLELLTEGGRNRDVGKVLLQADEVVYYALKKHLTRLDIHGHGASKGSLAYYVGMQISALEIFKLEDPSAKESREVSMLFKKGLLSVLNGVKDS
ncbi:TetR/AcrR family transcriptional regulator [Desulfovibrio sp. JC022]|uniref:TetR/AcrR family transcriptional regulator n=1 Tax=Desulfovibrio sp. JC022 TaxID=2593642 RepID=UPI0013D040B7|nr:TetR/AcrR family transcriptional regulator [Desulfovibrio sp. JC022]NDV22284.1 TetR/AcrR family transcriptional regulator [Desulfovibrio sp. JC022]